MPGLVAELQADALNPNTRVSDLLRKAKVVSVKLGLGSVTAWIEFEMNGYPMEEEVPSYRQIQGKVKFLNPYQGWMPVIFGDSEFEYNISQFTIRQDLASLEDVAERSASNGGFLSYSLPGEIQMILARQLEFDTEFQIQFSISQATGVSNSVRNRILDWSLELENAGVHGNDLSFSKAEQEAAKAATRSNIYNIQNVGVLGSVSDSSVVKQRAVNFSSKDHAELANLIEKIRGVVDHFDGDLKASVELNTKKLADELNSDDPNPSKITTILESLKSICEGAGGNLIASGIASLISKIL